MVGGPPIETGTKTRSRKHLSTMAYLKVSTPVDPVLHLTAADGNKREVAHSVSAMTSDPVPSEWEFDWHLTNRCSFFCE